MINDISPIPFHNTVETYILTQWYNLSPESQDVIWNNKFKITCEFQQFKAEFTFRLRDMSNYIKYIQYHLEKSSIRIKIYWKKIQTHNQSDIHTRSYYESIIEELVRMFIPFCHIYKVITRFWSNFQSILKTNLNDPPIEVTTKEFPLLL